MKIEIIDKELNLAVSGFSGTAFNKDYAQTAFKLMDRMWPIVKANGLKHKGMNIWVYEPDHKVFAGVELDAPAEPNIGLELKNISLKKYGYYKHIGPYSLIKQAGTNMTRELESKGFKVTLPYIEIYGHWNNDESKLETELLMAVE